MVWVYVLGELKMKKQVYLTADGIKKGVDPIELHDVISTGFANIEKVIREESAKMGEAIRQIVTYSEGEDDGQ